MKEPAWRLLDYADVLDIAARIIATRDWVPRVPLGRREYCAWSALDDATIGVDIGLDTKEIAAHLAHHLGFERDGNSDSNAPIPRWNDRQKIRWPIIAAMKRTAAELRAQAEKR